MTQRGISLLETLMVVSIAAILLTLGVKQVRQFQHGTLVNGIHSDLRQIGRKVNQYFRQQGCNEQGEFVGNREPDLSHDLQLTLKPRLPLMAPVVPAYRIAITDNGFQARSERPLYQIMISAEMHSDLSQAQLAMLQQQLNAVARQGHVFYWRLRPGADEAQPQSLWMMQGVMRSFQKFASRTHPGNSVSNCAW